MTADITINLSSINYLLVYEILKPKILIKTVDYVSATKIFYFQ